MLIRLSGVTLIGAAAAVLAAPALAGEHRRQMDSHEHGVTTLNIAAEGNQVVIELEGPAMNFVGFEHEARTDEQKAAIADTVAILSGGSGLFGLSSAADCRLTSAAGRHVTSDSHDDHSDHDDHASHDDHSDHNDHSDHDDHADHDDHSDHADHDDHSGHDDHADGSQHSEFAGEYEFECGEPDRLSEITVRVLELFPLTNEVEASFVGDTYQTFKSLTAADPTLSLER